MPLQLSTPSIDAGKPASAFSPTIVPHEAGDLVDLSGFGIHWKLDGSVSGKRFSVVHHPLAPRHLAAPLHRHHREDEFSYVLSGRMGALLGDEVVVAEAGTWVVKPRGSISASLQRSGRICRRPRRSSRSTNWTSIRRACRSFAPGSASFPAVRRASRRTDRFQRSVALAGAPQGVLAKRFGLR